MCFAILGLVGCTMPDGRLFLNSHSVKSVTLECIDSCLKMKDPPFLEKTFRDQNAIRLFVLSIRKSEKMSGELDYAGIFAMNVRLKGGKTEKFVLNISNEENYTKGLLVRTSDSGQGYEISQKMTQKLRDLIYNSR